MMRLLAVASLALALTACDKPEDPAPVDIEQMNKDALGPPVQITLDPINFALIEKFDLFGAGCSFRPEGWTDLAIIANDQEATIIIGGEAVQAAADAGSRELPYGARAEYDGLSQAFELNLDEGEQLTEDYEVSTYSGTLIVRDDQDRVVYEQTGTYECGA
ncbi:hypothetical protein AMC99_01101 [Altererythrobacter epoxidivorans]|uniref:Lipoprotein n=2 Tax=Altererythrobacter epoxidivorans TaxID=361183 RepID=A0A0M4LUR1_9SPHN|nr:hypothetical protein AMC99_01101 [Altererythrobacter epoxidivorans]